MKALVGAFNQEKALVGAFSVIVQPVVEPMELYTALFKAEQEFPVSAVSPVTSSAGHYGSPSQPSQQLPGQDTGDLAYSLTRIEVCCIKLVNAESRNASDMIQPVSIQTLTVRVSAPAPRQQLRGLPPGGR